jgi:hypothetical protein
LLIEKREDDMKKIVAFALVSLFCSTLIAQDAGDRPLTPQKLSDEEQKIFADIDALITAYKAAPRGSQQAKDLFARIVGLLLAAKLPCCDPSIELKKHRDDDDEGKGGQSLMIPKDKQPKKIVGDEIIVKQRGY